MIVRPGCKAELWYGFDYSGVKKTYPAGIYTNVGPVDDPNVRKFIPSINLTRLPGTVPQLIGLFLFCIEFGCG